MSIHLMGMWMKEMDTDLVLRRCILQYAQGRGSRSLQEICGGEGEPYEQMARSQDVIGWQRFMEGMVCREMRSLQESYLTVGGSSKPLTLWAPGLVTRLLEITHGPWL
jgi:hypothetical protein